MSSSPDPILQRLQAIEESLISIVVSQQSLSKEIQAHLAALAKQSRLAAEAYHKQQDPTDWRSKTLLTLNEVRTVLRLANHRESTTSIRRLCGLEKGYPAKITGLLNVGTLNKANWRVQVSELKKFLGEMDNGSVKNLSGGVS